MRFIIVGIFLAAIPILFFQAKGESTPLSEFLEQVKEPIQKVFQKNPADLNSIISNGKGQGSDLVKFGVSPMRPEDIGVIIPLGLMVKGHVTPIDHTYFHPKSGTDLYQYDVFAPAPITDCVHSSVNGQSQMLGPPE